MAATLTLDAISYSYPFTSSIPVLDNISIVVNPGDVVCIAGRNGSGKSTLAQMAAGLLKPGQGDIRYGGESIRTKQGLHQLRNNIALLFQSPEEQLFADSVFKDISFGPRNRGLREPELRSVVRESCELAGLRLEEVEYRSPFSLSQGEKRMVAIAGIFALKPEVLILDEPFTGLDYENKKHILDSLVRYRESCDSSIIIITHELSSVWSLADKFGLLSSGKLSDLQNKESITFSAGDLPDLGLRLPQWAILNREFERMGIKVSNPSDCTLVAEAICGHMEDRDD